MFMFFIATVSEQFFILLFSLVFWVSSVGLGLSVNLSEFTFRVIIVTFFILFSKFGPLWDSPMNHCFCFNMQLLFRFTFLYCSKSASRTFCSTIFNNLSILVLENPRGLSFVTMKLLDKYF